MANQKSLIDSEEEGLSEEEKMKKYEEIVSSKKHRLEDYGLKFYNPSDESVELVKDGQDTDVTIHNLQHYIDLVLDSTFKDSIQMQLKAFRKGF